MLMIRLQRVGRKNDPSFRVVVVDHRQAAQTGKVIEVVGSHDPRNDRTEIKGDRAKYWISQGAQVSGTVTNLLVKKGIVEGKTVNVASTKLGKKAKAAVEAKRVAEEKAAKEAEAKKKAEEEAKKAEEEAKAEPAPVETEETPVATETPVE